MTIELKKPFCKLFGDHYGHVNSGIFLLRVATTIPVDIELTKDIVFGHMINEVSNANANNVGADRQEQLKDAIRVLKESPIVYHKLIEKTLDTNKVFYYQMIINASDNPKWTDRFCYTYVNYIYRHSEGRRINAIAPLGDVVYQFGEVTVANNYNKGTTILSSNSDLNTLGTESFADIQTNIALLTEVDTDKQYNRNSIVKAYVHCYDCITEAIEKKDKKTYSITCLNEMYPTLVFILPHGNQHGNTYFKPCYTGNINIEFYKDLLIFYDGARVRESVEPYLDRFVAAKIKMLNLLQFVATKDLFFGEMYNDNNQIRKLVLHFINKDKIFMSRSQMGVRGNTRLEGGILYTPRKGMKKKLAQLRLGFSGSFFGEAVVPVDNNNSQDRALRLIVEIIEKNLSQANITDVVTEYKKCFMDSLDQQEDDILSEWFEYCTRNMRNTDDRIVQAYVNMKRNLEKEYKEIGSYLNCYDFSRCSAIPRVSMDKKLKENYYKTLHVEPKSIIIKSINNKKINPITEIQPTMTVMMVGKGKRFVSHDFPLNKFINTQRNSLDLCYNEMKGEVNRAKTENRR